MAMESQRKPAGRPADSRSGMSFSERVARVGGKGARAWEVHDRARRLQAEGRDVIFLSVGDPDFDTPSPIVEAAVEALRGGRTHYTSMAGIPPLREAIAARHERLTGHAVSPDAVVVNPGAQCALFSTMMCIAQAGDEVIVPEPLYVTYTAVVGASGATLAQVPLRAENAFHLDPDDVAAAVTPRTRAVLINFPHNPSGAMITPDELAGLAKICRRHDLWLVSDEVYATLTYDGRKHVSPVTLPGMAERTVVIDSLSKAYAMTGWRLGWAIAPGELALHMANLAQCMLYGCPAFIQDAAVTALQGEFDEIEVMRDAFHARRNLVVERVNAMPHVRCTPPEGSMFIMIDVRDSGLGAEEFAFRLVDAEGVSMLPCDPFGPSAVGHLRVSLSAPIEVLEEACNRLERFLGALNR